MALAIQPSAIRASLSIAVGVEGMECHLPKDADMDANLAAQDPLLVVTDLFRREEVIELDGGS
jgi:hypothetical protein